jgi:hypothetical protein
VVEDYGALFAGVGHVIQLFDTGLSCTPESAARLVHALERHGLAFRIAVGAFDRTGAEPLAAVCWQTVARQWKMIPGYSGFWIFPAGQEIASSLWRMDGAPRAVAQGAGASGGPP